MYSALPSQVNLRTCLTSVGPRAEAQLTERAAEVGAAHESDLRVEVVADRQILGLRAVAVGAVVEPSLVALVVAVASRRSSVLRAVDAGAEVLEERERAVDAVRLVRARAPTRRRDRLVNIAPMVLRRRMSRLTRTTVKLVGLGPRRPSSSPVWMFITPTPYCPTLPVSRPPTSIGMTRLRLRPMRRL